MTPEERQEELLLVPQYRLPQALPPHLALAGLPALLQPKESMELAREQEALIRAQRQFDAWLDYLWIENEKRLRP